MLRLRGQHALVAFVVGVVVIAGVLAIVLSLRSWQRSGYNDTPVQLVIGTLPAGTVGCQPHESLPAGTGAVRIHATSAGVGPVRVRVALREAGRYTGTGATGTVAAEGTIVAALVHPVRTEVVASLCVWNTGQATLALSGAATGPADQLTVATAGRPATATVGRVRIEDLTSAHPSSLWPVLGKLPERIATATGSALAPWLVVIGLIGTLLATAVLLRAPEGDDEA
jgi:hypothetical protein